MSDTAVSLVEPKNSTPKTQEEFLVEVTFTPEYFSFSRGDLQIETSSPTHPSLAVRLDAFGEEPIESDHDCTPDSCDADPNTYDPSVPDADGDDIRDACDPDDDNDGHADVDDAFP